MGVTPRNAPEGAHMCAFDRKSAKNDTFAKKTRKIRSKNPYFQKIFARCARENPKKAHMGAHMCALPGKLAIIQATRQKAHIGAPL